ncbi:MAG: hypothetical protein FWD17_04830 [Polyangiaceae bacterium]|nr:hypothetical protein [Polyangiaceae bacterium]
MQARVERLVPVTVACIGAILAVQAVSRDIRVLGPVVALAILVVLPAAVGRWRMRRLLRSGDVQRVIGTWEGSIRRLPHRDTMAPLLRATAYASYGWIEAARHALERAVRGPAWDAALEQRLFIETLLDTFEGDRQEAVRKAAVIEALPAPSGSVWARRRVVLLRQGLGALARAFAHTSQATDARLLVRAAAASPLVHWAMRYAAAVVALDHGRARDVESLLAGAPPWPEESAFHTYHDELMAHAAAFSSGASAPGAC